MLNSQFKISANLKFTNFPVCCNLLERLINAYLVNRIHFLIKNWSIKMRTNKIKKCGSKSIGMRIAAAEISFLQFLLQKSTSYVFYVSKMCQRFVHCREINATFIKFQFCAVLSFVCLI